VGLAQERRRLGGGQAELHQGDLCHDLAVVIEAVAVEALGHPRPGLVQPWQRHLGVLVALDRRWWVEAQHDRPGHRA
jgi:hypothetical protein